MANLKKTFELAFAIGGKLDASFKTAHGEAAAQIEKLSKKSSEAMAFKKLQREHNAALKNFTDAAGKMKSEWGGVIDSVVGPLKQIATIGAIAGAAVYGLAAKTAKMGDDAVKGAAKIGVTTQEFSKMSFAATQSGMSAESFLGTMKKMNTIVNSQVIAGKTDLIISGKRRLSLIDENKRVKDRARILLESADAYTKLTSETEKQMLATFMFGKAGTEMIPMLEQGSAGIGKLMKDAERLGIVFDDVSGQKAVAFSSSMTDLKAAAQGLAISIGKQLHEPLTRVNEAIVNWVVSNRELIEQKVAAFISDIVKWLKENKQVIIGLKDSVVDFVKQIGVWIEKNGGLLETLKKVGKAFLAIKALGFVFAIMSAVAATATFIAALVNLVVQTKAILAAFGGFKAVAGVIAGVAAPVLAVVAAVASLGVATYMLIKHWDGVVYFFKNLKDTVPIFINDLVNEIAGLFGKLPNWIQNIVSPIKNIILGPILAIQALLSGNIKGFLVNLGKTIISYIYTVPLIIANAGNEIIKALFSIDIIGAVKDWIEPAVRVLSDTFDTTISAIKNFFVAGFNNIKSAFGGGFFEGILEVFKTLDSGIKNILFGIPKLFITLSNNIIKAMTGIDILSVVGNWINGVINIIADAIDNIYSVFAGIVAVIKGILLNIKGIFVNVISSIGIFFTGEFNKIKEAFEAGFFSGIKEIILRIPTLFIRMLNNVVKAIASIDIIGAVSAWAAPVVGVVADVFDSVKAVFSGVVEFVRGFFLRDLMGITAAFDKGFISGINEILGRLLTLIPRLLNDAIKAITGIDIIGIGKNWIQRFIDGVLSALKNAGGVVKDAVKSLLPDSVVNIMSGATKMIGNATKAAGSVAKAASKILPKFGDGGIATRPSIVAEDGRPEMVIPMTKPARAAELIRQIAPVLPDLQVIQQVAPSLPKQPLTSQSQSQRESLPLEILRNVSTTNTTNKNVNGGAVTFSPNINISGGGGDSTSIKAAVEEALAKAQAQFERWSIQRENNLKRVAMA